MFYDFSLGDDNLATRFICLAKNILRIVAPICQKCSGTYPIN